MSTTLATSTVPTYPSTISTPVPCGSCNFGVTAAALHSFPYTIIATVTAFFTPYAIFYDDGCVSTSTCVETSYPPGITSSPGIAIFSNVADMTWTASDVPMSYPTTYVEYLGFERDSATVESYSLATSDHCVVHIKTTPIELPSPTTAASFIYPLQGPLTTHSRDTAYVSVAVPTPLIDYLEQVASGPSGEALDIKGCGTLSQYFIPASVVSSACYTTYATLTTSTTAYTTSTSTCNCGESTTTITSPVVTPSIETLTAVECYLAVNEVVTTHNLTTTISQVRAFTQENQTLPTISVSETRLTFTDDFVVTSADRFTVRGEPQITGGILP